MSHITHYYPNQIILLPTFPFNFMCPQWKELFTKHLIPCVTRWMINKRTYAAILSTPKKNSIRLIFHVSQRFRRSRSLSLEERKCHPNQPRKHNSPTPEQFFRGLETEFIARSPARFSLTPRDSIKHKELYFPTIKKLRRSGANIFSPYDLWKRNWTYAYIAQRFN